MNLLQINLQDFDPDIAREFGAGATGMDFLGVSLFDGYGRLMCNESKTIPPSRVIGSLCLRKPIYFDMCLDGLFSKVDALSILDLSALRKRTAKKGKRA